MSGMPCFTVTPAHAGAHRVSAVTRIRSGEMGPGVRRDDVKKGCGK